MGSSEIEFMDFTLEGHVYNLSLRTNQRRSKWMKNAGCKRRSNSRRWALLRRRKSRDQCPRMKKNHNKMYFSQAMLLIMKNMCLTCIFFRWIFLSSLIDISKKLWSQWLKAQKKKRNSTSFFTWLTKTLRPTRMRHMRIFSRLWSSISLRSGWLLASNAREKFLVTCKRSNESFN